MIGHKERPKCRKRIEELVKNPLVTLEDIAKGYCSNPYCRLIDKAKHIYYNPERKKHLHTFYSDGLRKQARKMIQERNMRKNE